ncbi:RrF2 family transcriptional regulator [Mesoterricola silvestris]|uniref:Rrf2 family transcriptional regulator n=1 Tax=Mesoterricola silvestris TaxID=2927979 RepID=A0AA48K6X2_9BACT|nr:Rrf2 family transcriptional regulator [Mesoterricola silvestris]BDU71254.1 Rrf2 family transcriptional regulator [Mesoterricola silvestris]
MLGISRQTDYAVRVVLHLACLEKGAQVSIAEISESRSLPMPFVRRLIKPLVTRGILVSARGSSGGIRLARSAGDISLLDVVQAMEGGMALNHCADADKGCPLSGDCPVQSVWVGATNVLERHLAQVHFDTLAVGPHGHVVAHQRLHTETSVAAGN